jgi:small multidrug resistance pump
VGWVYLVGAILLEVAATSLIKSTHGFSRLLPSLACAAGYAASIVLLSQAVRRIDVGTAYAIWAGLGTVTVVVVAALFLSEPLTVLKATGVALVVAGVVVLNLSGAAHA